jgi:seryl-tRNA synthetase
VIEKIAEKEKKLKGVKKASKKIKELFKKRMGIMNLIERMNKDRNVLQKELIALIRKAKSFELSSKNANIGDQIVNIEKKFKEVDTKKKFFEKEVKKLNTFFK